MPRGRRRGGAQAPRDDPLPLFERTGPDRIEVHLPASVVDVVRWSAQRVGRIADEPGSAGFGRLLGPVDETGGANDPLITLARQSMLDELAATVVTSSANGVLTVADCEAWLRVLGMTLAVRAEELGVRTEADLDALGQGDQAFLAVVHGIQAGLLEALDGPVAS